MAFDGNTPNQGIISNMNLLKHKIHIYKLAFGLRVLHVHIPDFPISISSLWLNAGSRFDPMNRQGLAHLFEHLLFSETKKFPNKQKRLEEIERRGFLFNAFTTLETLSYYFVHSPEQSTDALDFLLDGALQTTLDERNIEAEKNIVLSEERNNFANPSDYIWRLANKGMWEGRDLGKDLFGTRKTITSITKKSVVNYYRKFFTPYKMLFVSIGPKRDIDNEIVLLKLLVSERCTNIDSQLNKNIRPGNMKTTKKRKKYLSFEKREIENIQLALSFETIGIDNFNDRLCLDFIKEYLGNGWTSRLINKLRVTNQLVYWVWPETAYTQDSGYLRFYLSVDKKYVNRVLHIFEEEVTKLKEKLISARSLEINKNKIFADITRNSLNYNWLMWWYAYDACISKNIDNRVLARYITCINRLTSYTIRKTAVNFLTKENFSVALIGKINPIDYFPTFQ